jgi:thiamine-monophosphate kinase
MAADRASNTDGGDEFALIARYFAPLAAAEPGAFGLGDDAAVLTPPSGCQLVATCDTIVEGVHFRADDPPESIGVKVLAVNLSDLAAMGARPAAYLLSAALPLAWRGQPLDNWLGAFTAGLAALQTEHQLALIGGDTVATGDRLCLTVTALGWLASGQALRRSGARPGDRLFVSGSIGDAGLGLAILSGRLQHGGADARATLVDRYRRPRPRVGLGQRLSGLARAAIDVSDGLIADLGHICRQSAVGATIWLERVPVSAAVLATIGADETDRMPLLAMGDDYELVFAVPRERVAEVAVLAGELSLPLTEFGVITAAAGARQTVVTVLGRGGQELSLDRRGYRHF